MKTVLTAAISALVVTIAALYLWPRPPVPADSSMAVSELQQQLADLKANVLQRPADLVIVLRPGTPQCTSETLPEGFAYRGQNVRWWIVNLGCNLDGREIELRFTDDDSPLDVRRPRHARFIRAKALEDARLGVHKYAVWAVGKAGDYELEDPELAIGDY